MKSSINSQNEISLDDSMMSSTHNIKSLTGLHIQSKDNIFNTHLEKINKPNKCSNNIILQTRLMVWKNYLLFKRNFKPTFFQLATPSIICFILVVIQLVLDIYTSTFINKHPDILKLEKIDKCTIPSNCTAIGYGVIVVFFNIVQQ